MSVVRIPRALFNEFEIQSDVSRHITCVSSPLRRQMFLMNVSLFYYLTRLTEKLRIPFNAVNDADFNPCSSEHKHGLYIQGPLFTSVR